ncbi:serine dehydratase subunit alpha family protein [Clostridium chrysemydis]|uniref:L-cysteine desulfidase family protein n=1 Tax=Clostridium chrysemydis TaxID=2665504 RepID=UPI001883BB4C|nr:L-serine ammonia-lyase, iron-sulfur-dependent, subunit alpha [Clostridium chrysemydis]
MRREFIEVLNKELVPAEGCTEPIAVALAVAKSLEILEGKLESIEISLSTNVIKNALGVGIPGTGKVGINIAVALGAIIRDSKRELEILSGFSSDDLENANEILNKSIIKIKQKNTEEKLYIEVCSKTNKEMSKVIVIGDHTNFVLIEKNGEILLKKEEKIGKESKEEVELSLEDIYNFSREVPFEDIKFLLKSVEMNRKVSDEGLNGKYGLQVGSKMIQKEKHNLFTNNIAERIIAVTAAASDARMDGCTMPIMTTAGSGNQGIVCSMPVAEVCEILGKSDEEKARALAISNLVTIHIKKYMGRLSPLCGAGIAGSTGASCGITYLLGGDLKNIRFAVNNMISDVAGMICDGAKSTCALKIATGVNAALQCANLAMNGITPSSKDGIINDDVEKTIKSIEKLVKDGLTNADNTILDIMLSK